MVAQVIEYVPAPVLGAVHQPASGANCQTVLVCDNALLRIGLQDILRGTPFAPAVTTSTVSPAVVQEMASEPALVLIEAGQSINHVLEVIRQMKEHFPQARIVALADRFDLGFVRLGHEAGVNGFCSTACGAEVLIKSLELVMVGESMLPFAVLRAIMNEAPEKHGQPFQPNSVAEASLSGLKACKLSAREREILDCLKEGAPNKLIARKLEITEATIKVHVKAILRKIGASNRTQAAMWAAQRLPRRGGASVSV